MLQLEPAPVPEVGRGEVRLRVAAAALNPKDVLLRKGRFSLLGGWSFPRGTGFDVAGTVEEAGPGVSEWRPGDRVFGFLNGFHGGSCADEVVVPVDQLAPLPASLSWVEAAALPLAGSTALQALRDLARVVPGSRVLIHGASGGVGVHAIQIARALGAHVTTTSSEANRERCAQLGAQTTLTYDDPQAPFAQQARYDAIFDVFGNRRFAWAIDGLARGGTYVTTVPSSQIGLDAARTLLGERRARLVVVRARRTDLDALARMIDIGALRPVVDRVFPLEETAEAQRYLESRHARGKIVISVDLSASTSRA